MPNSNYSKNIVYLSQAQYQELITNGTITVNDVTVTYNENDIYVTPQAEPVTDVRVNGTSISSGGVANIPMATTDNYGVVKLGSGTATGLRIESGLLKTDCAGTTHAKGGTNNYMPIVPAYQHASTFYGLAKASRDTTQSSSSNPVGTYTDEAKQSIQQMLGVSSLIAPSEPTLVASKAYAVGDVFTANGKLYKVTTAIAAAETIVVQNEGETVSGHNAVETSLSDGFVKFTDYPIYGKPGVVQVDNNLGIALNYGKTLKINKASDAAVKGGEIIFGPIVPGNQHQAAFYGLAKAAGDTTQSQSSNVVGTYTDEAKAAIKSMIGVNVEDVQVNETSVLSNGVANIPVANSSSVGVVRPGSSLSVSSAGALEFRAVGASEVKAGTTYVRALTPERQHASVFYGLAKAAGADMASSENAIGTYTADAKAAIKSMIGVNVDDVQIDGTSVVTNGIATIPVASTSTFGVVKCGTGLSMMTGTNAGKINTNPASTSACKNGAEYYSPITPNHQHEATFYGLAKASGDTTQSASSNAVGTYTDSAKASIKSMLGIVDGSTGTVTVSGTTPTITAVENTRYVCGEVATLTITPPASGICIIRFTSGTTATVLTATGVVWPEWFDATALEASRVYEICITDGYGAVMSWAL